MKISLSNLVRLQEAATSPYDTPPEADQTVEDKDKKKEEAGKAAYAERALKTADEYGGYAPPAAIS